ncbi:MAG TPA: DUF1236 domain-containing protein [Caulobacteraceae bacterium]|jgi:hypothetical protein
MKLSLICGAAALTLMAGSAFAQQTTVVQDPATGTTTTTTVEKRPGGAAGGAVAGAAVGAAVAGPVGAVVGGVVGAATGAAVAPPAEVRTYVTSQDVAPVTYSGEVVMGRPIHEGVTWLEIPAQPRYRWAYLNGRRVVVDIDTHNVVAIY